MKLDLLLLPVPVVASKQPQLGSSLASKGLPCVPASHTCLGPAVLLQCQGVRQEQGLAVEALSGRRKCCQAGWGKPGI